MTPLDLTGYKFGKLTVLGRWKKAGVWQCLCDCGKRCNVNGWGMRLGKRKSCGCDRPKMVKGFKRREHDRKSCDVERNDRQRLALDAELMERMK